MDIVVRRPRKDSRRLEFPFPRQVRDFFHRRARSFGLDVRMNGEAIPMSFPRQTSGSVVLFGGGKDSRLLLGTLDELGRAPKVVAAWGTRYAADLQAQLATADQQPAPAT